MEILRFALGARFPLPGATLEAAFEKECLQALLQALRRGAAAALRGKKGLQEERAWALIALTDKLEQYLENAENAGFSVLDLTYSPITGQEGNIEYLGFLEKGAGRSREIDLQAVIDESHAALKG